MNAAAKTIIHYVGAFMLLNYVGGVAILIARIPVPESVLTAMFVGPTGIALGGLIGMLARTGGDGSGAQPVTVTNAPDQPVPTTEAQ